MRVRFERNRRAQVDTPPRDVQALLNISATSAKRLLSAMVDDKLLVMEGKGPGGHYRRWRP